jgi:H+/Cl- antiporter ClcA
MGSGLGALAVRLTARDAPPTATTVIAAAGSFAAISALFGSPLLSAFLMLEAAGIGGPMLGLVLLPGLLAAGIGELVFIGLDSLTGFGTFSLAVPDIPPVGSPTGYEFLWAIGIGILAAFLGMVIRRLALALQPIVAGRSLVLTPLAGVAIGILVLIFVEATDKPSAYVLFSGQDQLPGLIEGAATWSVGALILLAACKGFAYSIALSGFRGGPVFPGMFVGAVVGIALSHLPGLSMVAGAAMGIGAMTVAMLGLPLVSLLLVVLFLQADSVQLTPLVIVAIVVSYIVTARLTPVPAPEAAPSTAPPAAAPS